MYKVTFGKEILKDSSSIFLEDLKISLLARQNLRGFGTMKVLIFKDFHTLTPYLEVLGIEDLCININMKSLATRIPHLFKNLPQYE